MSDLSNEVLIKIRKLIEHERSAREIGSLLEADAFAAKISELCDRHRIAISEVPEAERRSDIQESDWEPSEAGEKQLNRRSVWQVRMASAIAHGHYCALMLFPRLNDVRFAGSGADVEVAKAMMTILCRAAREACSKARRQNSRIAPNQFLYGFAVAISNRYHQQRAEQEAQHSGATRALVRSTKALVLERYGTIPEAKPMKQPRYGDSMQDGYKAGMQANINNKLLGEASSPRLLTGGAE